MKLWTRHLDEVGETYFEHLCMALSFAKHMLFGALACAIHAIFPFLFETTGSQKITQLHERMVLNRKSPSSRQKAPAFSSLDQTVEELATQSTE